MNIQKLNYDNYGNINFKKNKCDAKEKQVLNCNIQEYSDNKKRIISFNFNKDDLFKFFKNLINKFRIFKKHKDTLNIQIDLNTNEVIKSNVMSPMQNTDDKIDNTILDFPTPKFKSNPTIEQRDEYIKDVLKFYESTPDIDNRLKALKEVEKYGINDLGCMGRNLIGGENETLMQETLKIYQKWGKTDDIYVVMEPISSNQIKITEEKTFVEVLKTIQKLAKLETFPKEDRKVILEPITRLLNYENENIRKMAQETLDKMTPKEQEKRDE